MTSVTIGYYKEKMTLTYFLLIILLLVLIDLGVDFVSGMPLQECIFDIFLEGSIISTVFAMARYIWKKFTIEKDTRELIQKDLEKTKEMASEWEQKSKHFVAKFQIFILAQFDQWCLSKSEKEIALLILQGKSAKEIAAHRFTSERTIRNQCRTIYEKSNTTGKVGLMTYFFGQFTGEISLN